MIPSNTPVYTGVIVKAADNPRDGQAGAYLGPDAATPNSGLVRFDSDGAELSQPLDDLQRLGN